MLHIHRGERKWSALFVIFALVCARDRGTFLQEEINRAPKRRIRARCKRARKRTADEDLYPFELRPYKRKLFARL